MSEVRREHSRAPGFAAPGAVPMAVPPYRLSGRIFGTLLNHRSALTALGAAVHEAPYKAPPRAPVLYIKPRNTLALDGATVGVPADAPELAVGACLGVVIGRAACRVASREAPQYIAGYLIVNDVCVPHASYHRPAVRYNARDGFCPLGPRVTARALVADPDRLGIRVFVDGTLRQSATTAELVRPVAQLLSDVSEFMTLAPGDVLAAGAAWPAPRVRAGECVAVEIDGLGRLENAFRPELS